MSDLIIKKNGTDYNLPMLAEHYPADRVYLDGDINKTVQDAVDDLPLEVAKTGTFNVLRGVASGNNGGWGYAIVCPFLHDKSKTVTITKAEIVFVGNISDLANFSVNVNESGYFLFRYTGNTDLTNKLIAITVTLS